MPRRCELGCEPSDPAKYPERFRAWVTIVGGKLEKSHDYEDYRKRKLCDIHFTDKDRNRNHRLNALAVPSLHLPSSIPAITLQETNISSVSESLSTGPSTSFTAKKRSLVIFDTECETQPHLSYDTGPHSKCWDACDQKDDALKKLNVKDASTQTSEYNNKDIDANIIKSNESFGVFIAQELLNVPLIKRRHIMSEIIRLFEH
ncbi:uncharacterized protein LOC123663399 isoform X2 [Melitaea cinxia]|uniref:uncharacterized protein LOC123663399 isoform X2 n=1 Tax=Melitaea cinxia TaxID=113334 RepID=UPI001E272100|nr:uncharacterized protein LOC123663399 isoform X2 [Melitaea cinxia]